MYSKTKRLIKRVLGAAGTSHWTTIANGMDFRSGLGDSAWLLYGLCRSMKPSVCVEIGSARGKSACFVGMALKENGGGQLYAIDPHARTNWNDSESVDTYHAMRDNLERLGLNQFVTIVRKSSFDALLGWSEPIDLMFIDGDHSYEGVKADWAGFKPFMKPFSLVVFHDTIWDLRPDPKWSRPDMGVPRFVEELRCDGYQVLTIDRDYGVSVVQPVKGGNPLVLGRATSIVGGS
jgi:predicted O-methyltransferase YrrM